MQDARFCPILYKYTSSLACQAQSEILTHVVGLLPHLVLLDKFLSHRSPFAHADRECSQFGCDVVRRGLCLRRWCCCGPEYPGEQLIFRLLRQWAAMARKVSEGI